MICAHTRTRGHTLSLYRTQRAHCSQCVYCTHTQARTHVHTSSHLQQGAGCTHTRSYTNTQGLQITVSALRAHTHTSLSHNYNVQIACIKTGLSLQGPGCTHKQTHSCTNRAYHCGHTARAHTRTLHHVQTFLLLCLINQSSVSFSSTSLISHHSLAKPPNTTR